MADHVDNPMLRTGETTPLHEWFSRSILYRAVQHTSKPGAARTLSQDSTDWGS